MAAYSEQVCAGVPDHAEQKDGAGAAAVPSPTLLALLRMIRNFT
jgi:hypothetical protein